MEQKYQNIIILTILLVSVAWFVILTINGQNIRISENSRVEGNWNIGGFNNVTTQQVLNTIKIM